MNDNKAKATNSNLKPLVSFIYRHFKFVFCVIWFTFLIIEVTQCIRSDLRNVVVNEIHHELVKKEFNLDHKLNKMNNVVMSHRES